MLICKLLFTAMTFLSSYWLVKALCQPFGKAVCQTINLWSNDLPIFLNYSLLSFCMCPLSFVYLTTFTCSSDFYIFRKSCNCYFTAENIMKSVSCFLHLFPKPILAKGLCIRMSSIIIELSRQIDFFKPFFSSKVVLC